MTWRKSSFSAPNQECIEVAYQSEAVGVRDSKNPNGPVLTIAPGGWYALLRVLD